MRKSFLSGIGLMLCAFVAQRADVRADGPPAGCCEKGYYEKVVTAYKPVCKEERVPVVVKKLCYRDEMRPTKVTVMVPREFIEKRNKVENFEVPVEKCIQRCRKVPVKLIDPKTGCSVVVLKDEYYTDKITVMEPRSRVVCVDVKVCRQVPEERIVMQPCKVPEWREETIYVMRQHTEMIPYQKVLKLPCPPLGPNYSQEVPLVPGTSVPGTSVPRLPPAPVPYGTPAPVPPAPLPPAPSYNPGAAVPPPPPVPLPLPNAPVSRRR